MRSHLPGHKEGKQFFRNVHPNSRGGTSTAKAKTRRKSEQPRIQTSHSRAQTPVKQINVKAHIIQNFLIIDFKSMLMNHLACQGITPPKLVNCPPAGRLVRFQQNWSKVTQDQWVLNTILGYLIDFSIPHQPVILHYPQYSAEQSRLISEEVTELLQKGAIGEVVPVEQTGFYSNFFLVPKKDGGQRPVINLKALNNFVNKEHFKMEAFTL